MRRLFIAAAALASFGLPAGVASAEPPVHEREIIKDGTATVTPPSECPGPATTLEITFNSHFHAIFTDETFHVTGTTTGTFVGYDANGDEVSSGHFVNRFNDNGPGFPKLTSSFVLKANGSTVGGERINLKLHGHVTITPDDEVAVEFFRVSC